MGIKGDDDPLDICVLTEKTIPRGDILLQAIPIGGLRTIDRHAADDKSIAVMQQDAMYGEWRDITDCSPALLERLRHYFLTYKEVPHAPARQCEITHVYDRQEAYEIIRRSQEDYRARFGDPEREIPGLASST